MSSLVLSALLICFLIPIHGITACQLAPRKLSAADVNTPADPAPSPPNHCTHGTGGLSPQNKGVGGFCGGRATKHSRYNGESGRQVQLAHTLNCSLYEPSVLEQSWTFTLQWGIWWCSLFLALWHFKRVSSIISFVSVHVAWQIKHSGQRWSDWKTHGFYCLHKLYPRKKTGQISLYSLQELSVTKSPLKPSKDVLLGGNVHSFKMIFKPLKPPKITLNKINK